MKYFSLRVTAVVVLAAIGITMLALAVFFRGEFSLDSNQPPAATKTFTSDIGHISFDIPTDWRVIQRCDVLEQPVCASFDVVPEQEAKIFVYDLEPGKQVDAFIRSPEDFGNHQDVETQEDVRVPLENTIRTQDEKKTLYVYAQDPQTQARFIVVEIRSDDHRYIKIAYAADQADAAMRIAESLRVSAYQDGVTSYAYVPRKADANGVVSSLAGDITLQLPAGSAACSLGRSLWIYPNDDVPCEPYEKSGYVARIPQSKAGDMLATFQEVFERYITPHASVASVQAKREQIGGLEALVSQDDSYGILKAGESLYAFICNQSYYGAPDAACLQAMKSLRIK